MNFKREPPRTEISATLIASIRINTCEKGSQIAFLDASPRKHFYKADKVDRVSKVDRTSRKAHLRFGQISDSQTAHESPNGNDAYLLLTFFERKNGALVIVFVSPEYTKASI